MVELPPDMTRKSLRLCLQVAASIVNSDDQVVQVDATRLRFIDPFGLTVLAAACEKVGQSRRTVEVVALNPIYGGYLERMDLFRQPWMRCDVRRTEGYRTDARAKLVELKQLTRPAEVDPAANALASALLGWVPELDERAPLDAMTGYNAWTRLHEPLCHTFTELLQNAVTHARRAGFRNANVWVTAQYLQKVDRFHIGIVDTGCGFLASLHGHPELRSNNEESAILLALQPRISCNRSVGMFADVENAGIGLTTAARIARQSAGIMTIVSGDAVVQVGGRGVIDPAERPRKRWQGAGIAIELSRQDLSRVAIRDLMPAQEFGRPAPKGRFE